MKVVVDLIGMQIDQRRQTTSFSFQLLQALALRTSEIELCVVLSDYYLDSLKSTRTLLETIVPNENIYIWYAPIYAKKNKRSKQFAALALFREAFIQDLKPDVLILPDYINATLFNAPVSISHLPINTQLIVCISDELYKFSPRNQSTFLSRANLICCFSQRSYHLLVNKFGVSHDLLSLQDLGENEKTSAYASANERYFENGMVQMVSQIITHVKRRVASQLSELQHGVDLLYEHLGKSESPTRLKAYAKCITLNHYSQRSKIMYIDISFLHQQDHKTGIQRVVRSLLREFLKSPPVGYCVEPVFSIPGKEGFYFARRFAAESMQVPTENLLHEPIEPIWGDTFLGLDYTGDMLLHQANYLKTLHQRGISVEFVVYDLLPILRPRAFPPKMFPVFKQWLEMVLSFDGAICISKAVAEELRTYIGVTEPRLSRSGAPFNIRWFHLGADIENSIPTLGIPIEGLTFLKKFKETLSFLMVSTIEPRKGHALVLSAFEQLWTQGVDVLLVIVGKQGWKVEDLIKKIGKHPELNKRLFWLDGVSDEFLQQVYENVHCFIGMSEAEGFGLPLIEASRYKLPLIVRNIPVFKEVAKDDAYYFNGKTATELSVSLREWIKLYYLDKHPKSDTMPWLTWVESANQLKAQLFI